MWVIPIETDDMESFDKLPPTIRRAIGDAAFPLSAEYVTRLLERYPEATVISVIEESSAALIRYYAMRHGPDHPQAQ